ncbi:MAG: MlaE family ABC transporter permease [Alphaproteobacteria bacterium]
MQEETTDLQSSITTALKHKSITHLILKNDGIQKWDSSLVIVLYRLLKTAHDRAIIVNTTDLPAGLNQLLSLAFSVDRKPTQTHPKRWPFPENIGDSAIHLMQTVGQCLSFSMTVFSAFNRWLHNKAVSRRVDFLFALDECGPKAIGIVSLISFMVGLILAFVGAIQLKTFGAQIYVASLVTIGMTRIMGAIMVGIIMAGRTGASYAASIGTMQVNEELDALKTMGIPVADFLILPRLLALMIAMPILTFLADIMGMLGGAAVGVFVLGIPAPEYWQYSIDAFNMTNFWVGIFHGFIFGIVIALCGCYYGVTCGRNADSVGLTTTRAVVAAIVWMIVMTGLITWGCEVIGI